MRTAISKETLKELHRLREEIFSIRSRESQQDQEIEFLQRQLIAAADRIAAHESGSVAAGVDNGRRPY